ncbi:NAD-dependent epimerase/dehydratase family protein [Bradyrhizobium lupini]|uniref:NAD-dependent epimerase/dehydratase family protein n=1 Tax=Rhizobium lupini TaxID=136996 RepID=UPI0034C6D999
MRIFVAGATGAVGQYLVPALVAAGHSVIGTTRSAAKTDLVRRLGAEPVVADGLDADSMRAAVIAAKPNAVIHQMTDLAAATDLRHFDRAFKRTNELRTRGTDILLNAAREAGAKRFIAQSFCGWTFSRAGGTVKIETDELDSNPPRELRRTLEAIRYLEQNHHRFDEAGGHRAALWILLWTRHRHALAGDDRPAAPPACAGDR